MGDVPGEEPRGGAVVAVAGMIALLVAAGAALVRSFDERGGVAVFALLAPAGAAYLIVRWYSFDPYYLPSLLRLRTAASVAPGSSVWRWRPSVPEC